MKCTFIVQIYFMFIIINVYFVSGMLNSEAQKIQRVSKYVVYLLKYLLDSTDVTFLYKLFKGVIDSNYILPQISLNVPDNSI